MPYAVPADITSRWIGDDQPDDDVQLETFIADATVIIDRDVPDLAARLDQPVADGGVSSDEVKLVVVAMVKRLYKNPEGIRARQNTTGPFGESVTYSGDNPGALELTSDELARLRGTASTTGPTAFSIDPAPDAGGATYIGRCSPW